jgi:hypothetical protein
MKEFMNLMELVFLNIVNFYSNGFTGMNERK